MGRGGRAEAADYWKKRIPWYPAGCFGPYRAEGYSRRELAADAAVHAVGVASGALGAVALLWRAALHARTPAVAASVLVYSLSLQAMLWCSAAFNMMVARFPKRRWALQLADHTGILLLIAGSYTPFLLGAGCLRTLAFVWAAGLASFTAKASGSCLDLLPLHVCCFLAMGWAALAIWADVRQALSPWALDMLVLVGILYTAGLVPWACSRVEFHNAIWHVFVLVASALIYAVIYAEVLATDVGTVDVES